MNTFTVRDWHKYICRLDECYSTQNRTEQLSSCIDACEFVLSGRKSRIVLISSYQAVGLSLMVSGWLEEIGKDWNKN